MIINSYDRFAIQENDLYYKQYLPQNYNQNYNNEVIDSSKKQEVPRIIKDTAKKAYENIFYSNLVNNADSFNEWLPYMITNDVRLDRISLPWNNIFRYNYTYINIQKSEINIDNTISSLRSEIINWIVNSDDLKDYRDHNINFVYSYNDMNWVKLFEISITSEDYENIVPSNEYPTDFSDF